MSEISVQELVHRASIHLNNAGLTLLSRHYYREALQVLRDAVLTVEHSTRLLVDFDVDRRETAPLADDFLETKMERSAKLMAASQASDQCAMVSVRVLSDDWLDAPFPLFMKDSETFYTIRIECHFDDRNDNDHSINCAAILMNFGVASMICATTSNCATTVSKYRGAALNLWTVAKKIFVLDFTELVGSPTALYVGMILYRCLIPSLVHSGLVEEARECSLHLDETSRLLRAWTKVCTTVRDFAPAA